MIGENIAFLRKQRKMSREEFASKIGVSRQAAAKWENGDTLPDISNCAAIAKLFDVTLDDLINYKPDKMGIPIPPKGKHVFGTVTVGERGQIVIPQKARRLFNINPGDSLIILGEEGNGIAIVKADDFLDMLSEVSGAEKTTGCSGGNKSL